MHFEAPGFQFVGDQPRRPHLLEASLGMAMDVAADVDELGLVGRQRAQEFVAVG